MTEDVFQESEQATPLTPDEQRELIPSLATRAELNAAERLNILEGRRWAMRPAGLRRDDLVTDAFARELHRRMFHRVWRWAGRYRTTERNLGWEAWRLPEGVRNACDDARSWLEHGTHPLPEIAVRLHHRLVVIHPWPNGNGRHARLMADVLLAARQAEALTWGARANLGVAADPRSRYLAALRSADAGDFAPLVAFASS